MTKDEMQSTIETELGRIAGTTGDLSDATCRSYARVICRQLGFDEIYTEYLEWLKGIQDGVSVAALPDVYTKALEMIEAKGTDKKEPDGTEPMGG